MTQNQSSLCGLLRFNRYRCTNILHAQAVSNSQPSKFQRVEQKVQLGFKRERESLSH